ncbi:post-transcriptional regulator [Alteribacter populi]|uniref:post-transcriptional regulator n=1 Tax=Alteribacter populi TaxID=2011011 RepID=UPI000BBB1E05|nr:post-transcriptional regulator [Alteribacter populi]
MSEKNFDRWKDDLIPALESKAEEWQLLGYDRVSVEDVWQCVTVKWQKELKKGELTEPLRVHRLIGDVFSLKATEYMNWLTIEAYKGPDYFQEENQEPFRLEDFNVEEFTNK